MLRRACGSLCMLLAHPSDCASRCWERACGSAWTGACAYVHALPPPCATACAATQPLSSAPLPPSPISLVYDTKGRFVVHRITREEAGHKLCKVRRMQFGKGGIPYIGTHDGRTIRYPDPGALLHACTSTCCSPCFCVHTNGLSNGPVPLHLALFLLPCPFALPDMR
jgi:Ribosomal family S4e